MEAKFLAIIIISAIISALSYNYLPDQVATHWNGRGNADSYSSRLTNTILFPAIICVFTIMLYYIPNIDPFKKNVLSFKRYYHGLILCFGLFFLYIQVLTTAWGLGYRYNMTNMILPAVGILFIFLGEFLKHTKRNWFAGIRTPWTLHSDIIWKKTHELASKLFKLSGLIMMLGIFIGNMTIIIAPIFITAIITIVYSYILYRTSSP